MWVDEKKTGSVIVEMKFGSHLYGTDGPNSDLDFKGVFLPTVESLILGERVKSITNNSNATDGKNTSQDVDIEFYSLHYFLKLALEGQTVALDMLHAPQSAILKSSHLWKNLVGQRSRFYTKNLSAFIGYARRQAAKYGIKGSRLAAATLVKEILETLDDDDKLSLIWDKLPEADHLYHVAPSPNGVRQYQMCGKIIQENSRAAHTLKFVRNFLTMYGERARLAERNEGVDWKAMSHALRAAYQVRELFADGTMSLPSPHAPYLYAVKMGRVDFAAVQEELETVMGVVETLAEYSKLPEKADDGFVKEFIHEAYGYSPSLDQGVFTDLSYDGG